MEIASGVSLQILNSDKFKDISISIRFMAPLNETCATKRSLLAMMMIDRTEAYPSKKAMSDHQDMLYGVSIGAQTVGYGQAQVLEIRCKTIDPCYVEEVDFIAQVLAFVHEIIFHPLLNEETLNEAKTVLRSKLQRAKDDPPQYAMIRGLQLIGKGTPLGVSSLGEAEQLNRISLADIKETHQQLLQQNRIHIIVCGNIQEQAMQELLVTHLPFNDRGTDTATHYLFHSVQGCMHEQEQRDINQCSIFLLWETNTGICDADYYALRLANAMLGQYPTSLLFQEVREKHSLCYSIYSNLISFDGALGITTAVEQKDIDQALTLIHAQFQRLQEGDFDDHLLQVSKTMTINSLKAGKDAMNSIIAQAYQNAVLNQQIGVDERIAMFMQITRADIERVMQKCCHCLDFVVSGEVSE